MAEVFVGKWQVSPPFAPEYTEFIKAVGKEDTLETFLNICTFELTLDGGNKLLNKSTVYANPPAEFQIVTVIGEKTQDLLPGLGVIEMNCDMEGGKLVSKATFNGKPLIKEIYVEGDNLLLVAQLGNIKCILKATRV